jgi:hypothetical protein
MLLNVSAVILFGLASAFLLKVHSRASGLTLFLFGLFVADTGAGPVIRQCIADLAHTLNALG